MAIVRYFNCYPHDPKEPDVVYVLASDPITTFKEHFGFSPEEIDPYIKDIKYGIVDKLTQSNFLSMSTSDLEVGWHVLFLTDTSIIQD